MGEAFLGVGEVGQTGTFFSGQRKVGMARMEHLIHQIIEPSVCTRVCTTLCRQGPDRGVSEEFFEAICLVPSVSKVLQTPRHRCNETCPRLTSSTLFEPLGVFLPRPVGDCPQFY